MATRHLQYRCSERSPDLPYHCALQPIEKIWAVVKNIEYKTTRKMTPLALKRLLESLFVSVPSSTFHSVWKESVRIGEVYLAAARPADPTVDQEMESDQSDSDDVYESQSDEGILVFDMKDWEDALLQANSVCSFSQENVLMLVPTIDSDEEDDEDTEY
ncbi:hypothetical protein BGZ65_001202 [Modicella reniformis]|uniref:Uncharacterized protein n=1 Tax=Modicella reniformis TaxID=1440133 RepID=A0A9P6ILN3_9FUNG|nr:hypothetical protein BGZ65_001202 [Modicella reniformis]